MWVRKINRDATVADYTNQLSRIKSLGIKLVDYANSHEGHLPPNLSAAGFSESEMTGYSMDRRINATLLYLKPEAYLNRDKKQPLIATYEKFKLKDKLVRFVLLSNGSALAVTDNDFDRMILELNGCNKFEESHK